MKYIFFLKIATRTRHFLHSHLALERGWENVNPLVLYHKELGYQYSQFEVHRVHGNPSRVVFILLLCSVYGNDEDLVCSLMSHLRYIWDADSVQSCRTLSSMTRKEIHHLPLLWELVACPTLVV